MARESQADRTKRAARIFAMLRKHYPGATTALRWSNPLELLAATVLSAQCTDERVNKVTPALFEKYRTAADYAAASQATLEQEVRTTGFFRNKAKSLRGACAIIAERHGGRVPETMEALLELPGVARKTANVVLGTAYGKNEGFVVDTHVSRLARRMGFSRQTEPAKIEQDLMSLVPRRSWTRFGHTLVLHGRAVCNARKPRCDDCPVNKLCPSAFKA